jgi:hypothetical protein
MITFKKQAVMVWMDLFCSRLEMMAGSFGIGNEPSGFIKAGSLAARLLASKKVCTME